MDKGDIEDYSVSPQEDHYQNLLAPESLSIPSWTGSVS